MNERQKIAAIRRAARADKKAKEIERSYMRPRKF